jgi:hypothetical protein
MVSWIIAIISLIAFIVLIFTVVIPQIQNVIEASERLEKAKEREKLLISEGCVETGRDPNTNNEIWQCHEGSNIPPLEE